MAKKKVLVLRTCEANMSSTNGFVWPESGYVEAPDWKPTNVCGNGLHGWLWGEGNGELGDWSDDAKWLVVKVDADKVIDLGGKVKFPSGEVVFCGSRSDATNYLVKKAPDKAVIGATVVAEHDRRVKVGDRGTAIVGEDGSAEAGSYGLAVAGRKGTAIVGDHGIAIAGQGGEASAGRSGKAITKSYGTAKVGNCGMAEAGEGGTATAGEWGTARVGDYGTATAGEGGKAAAGNYGRAIAGNYGMAEARVGGVVAAGEFGSLQLHLEQPFPFRARCVSATVGLDGILPNVKYVLDGYGKFVEANICGGK